MNVLYVHSDDPAEYNVAEWRCAIPARAINTHPDHKADVIHYREWPNRHDLSEDADIIIFQRLYLVELQSLAEHWRAKGKPVVIDLDDAYHTMPANLKSYALWHQGIVWQDMGNGQMRQRRLNMTPLDQLKAGIKVANGLTSPSKLILEDWSSYVSRGYFVPNYIEKDRYQAALKDRKENNRMVIGWGGSFAHVNSFTSSGVLDALRRIVEQNKQVEIWIAGDPAVYSLIPVSKYRKRFVPWVHPDGWPSVLTQFDIGLIPLAGQYDRRRSWIKSLEYSIMGIPWVGTDFEPNETFSNYGFTVPNRASKWVSALQICIDNYGWAKELAFEAQAMAESFDVYQNVDNLISTYETIIERAKNGRF